MDWKIDDSNIALEPVDLMSVPTSISDSMPLYSTTLPKNLYSNSLPIASYHYHETNANPETIISEINTTTKIPSNKISLIKEAQVANKDINTQVKTIPINSIQEKDIPSIAFNNSNRSRANSNSTILLNSTPHITVATNKNRKVRSLSLDSKKSPVINNQGLGVITSLSSSFAPSSEFDTSNLISPRLFTNLTVDGIQPIVINNININSNNNSNILSATSLTQNNITQNAIPHHSLTQNPTASYSVSSNIPLETTTSVDNHFTYGINRSNSLPNTNSHRTPILHSTQTLNTSPILHSTQTLNTSPILHSTQTLNTSPTNSLLLNCPNPNPNPNSNSNSNSNPNPNPNSNPNSNSNSNSNSSTSTHPSPIVTPTITPTLTPTIAPTITPPSVASNHNASPTHIYTVLPNSTNTTIYNPLTPTALPTTVFNQNGLRNISIPSNDNKNSTATSSITINSNSNIAYNPSSLNVNSSSVSSNLYLTDPNNQSITNLFGPPTANKAGLVKSQSPETNFQNTNPWLLEFQPMTTNYRHHYPNYHLNSIDPSAMESFNNYPTLANTSPTTTKRNINPSYYYMQ